MPKPIGAAAGKKTADKPAPQSDGVAAPKKSAVQQVAEQEDEIEQPDEAGEPDKEPDVKGQKTGAGFTAYEDSDTLNKAVMYFMEGPTQPTKYKGPMARVEFSCGITITTGKFQNMKPLASISIPCHPDKVDEAFDWCVDWTDARLQKIREEIEAQVGDAET